MQVGDYIYPGAERRIETTDSAEKVGDNFEAAYAYLWITDQPRALAAMCLYSYLMDSKEYGTHKRKLCQCPLGQSTYEQRFACLMTWRDKSFEEHELVQRIQSGISKERDLREKRHHGMIVDATLECMKAREKDMEDHPRRDADSPPPLYCDANFCEKQAAVEENFNKYRDELQKPGTFADLTLSRKFLSDMMIWEYAHTKEETSEGSEVKEPEAPPSQPSPVPVILRTA